MSFVPSLDLVPAALDGQTRAIARLLSRAESGSTEDRACALMTGAAERRGLDHLSTVLGKAQRRYGYGLVVVGGGDGDDEAAFGEAACHVPTSLKPCPLVSPAALSCANV